jgi:hypothetical protein
MIVLLAAGGVMAYFFLAPAQVAQVAPTLAIVVPSLAPPAAVETGPTTEPTAAPDVSYNGVSFSYNHFLGGGVNQEVLPAVQPDSNSAPFDVIPQHFAFTFTNYTLSNTFHTPQILVLPVDDYINMIPELKPRVELLKSLIASRPATVTNDLPFLPMWNAGMVFHSNLKYIDFKNGSGIRFLTMFSQGIMPVTNDSLFYTYQGITSDGKYYISIVMPVHTPKLPNEADLTQQDYDSINNNYNQYIQTVSSVLDTQDNSRYSPNLDWLDEMAASFSIKP